jgi:hypothetical protein
MVSYPLQLIWRCETTGRNLIQPSFKHFLGGILHDLGLDIAWRDTIDSAKVHPLDCEGLGKLQHFSLRCVVLSEHGSDQHRLSHDYGR